MNTRRQLLQAGVGGWALAGALSGTLSSVQAHANMGPVQPPVAAPVLRLTSASGSMASLSALVRGRITAMQLMFTGCSAVCPIQGAMFADVQQQLASAPADWRLLSVSIDPRGDGPAQLRQWLARYSAQAARWQAAVPLVKDVDRMLNELQGQASGLDRHTAQVFVFNRRSQIAFRTVDLPSAQEVISAMRFAAKASTE